MLQPTRRRLVGIAPHLAIGLAAALWTMHVSAGLMHHGVFEGPEGLARLAAPGWAFWFYLGKALFPVGLSLVYPHWADTLNAGGWLTWLPLLLAVGVTVVLGLAFRRRLAPSAVCLVSAALLLGPISGLFAMPFMMHSLVADHFQYAALLFFLLAAAFLVHELARTRSISPMVSQGGGLALVVLVSALSFVRAFEFRDSKTMWTDTMKKNPEAWVAYNNLGAIIADEALDRFEQAAFLSRDLKELEQKRIEASLTSGREAMAESLAREIKIRGDLLAEASAAGRAVIAEALPYLEKAVAMKAGNDAARHVLGNAYLRLNRPEEAERNYREAVEIDRAKIEKNRDPTLLINYATFLRASGRPQEAEALIREALRLRPEMRVVTEAAKFFGINPGDPNL
jgi:tetratricopeptide (TPR) repeat protein